MRGGGEQKFTQALDFWSRAEEGEKEKHARLV